ncbi:MAG TPA: S8 family serine peptidase [Thermoanaerobaculia bacterium]|jgi:ribosomal protein S5|nr:S8 family serine peptidase [Thermoanaerobaculia bacterium]
MNRLRKAIYHAVDKAGCHVISISLGWLKNKGVHEAVKYAVGKNVIVLAAAGNSVGFVVWPAAMELEAQPSPAAVREQAIRRFSRRLRERMG